MGRLGVLAALLAVAGCDGEAPAPSDVSKLAGVYAGTRTVVGDAPEVTPATVTVTADAGRRTVAFVLAVRGEAAVVLPGTVAASGTIAAGNLLGTGTLGLEFVVDPSGTIRGAYEVATGDTARSVASGVVAGRFTAEQFDLTLVEPEAGGVRVEYRTVRSR